MKMKTLPGWLSGLLVGGTFVLLYWLERRNPLRTQEMESKQRRTARNFAMASLSAAAIQIAEKPIVTPLSRFVERRRFGLLKQFSLPGWLETTLAVLLLDYTLYLWHILVHRVPFLWRFHQVHHVDLDMDASTAVRFHFGEMIASVSWRASQIMLIGVGPFPLSVWQTALLISILFHHSNVRFPIRWERWICLFIVTPRMHGIHHSIVEEETNSNWSSGFTLWDWLHRTLKLNIPQEEITIGIPAYRHPSELHFIRLVQMPFENQRPSWLLPGDGQPAREPRPVESTLLLE